jgi:Tfp pilus assembly protein PilF
MVGGADKMALYKSGMMSFVKQDFETALTEFERALEIDPDFGDVHQSVAHVYEKLGDYDSALGAAKRAAQCNPDDFLVHTSLSIIYQRKGMIAEAEAEKAKAAEIQQRESSSSN